MQGNKTGAKKVWMFVRWPLLVLVLAYAALVIYRIPAVGEAQRTKVVVANIQARHITMNDVEGSNLPPVPYQPENDATVAGIDKNGNGIRDDVERAIFAKYPSDAKVRAAELQYAMTEQMFLTAVFNTDTWKAVAEQESRAYACVGNTVSSKDLQILNSRIKEVADLVFNTHDRQTAKTKSDSFTTSFALSNNESCDIDLNSLK